MRYRILSRLIFSQDASGAAVVEFGLIAAVLAFLAMIATDCGLAMLRQSEVDNAARAGAEYVDLHGYDSSGITTAASSATSLAVTVTPSSYCGCGTGGAVVTQTCGTTCSAGGTAGAYVSVTTSASYSPLFPPLWSSRLSNSVLNLSSTVVTRTN